MVVGHDHLPQTAVRVVLTFPGLSRDVEDAADRTVVSETEAASVEQIVQFPALRLVDRAVVASARGSLLVEQRVVERPGVATHLAPVEDGRVGHGVVVVFGGRTQVALHQLNRRLSRVVVGIVGANPVAVRWNVVLTVFVDLSVVASRRVQNQPAVVHSVDDAHTHFAGRRPLQVFVGQRVDQQRGVVLVAEHQSAQAFEHLAAHESVVVDVVELSAAVERARFFVEVDAQRVGILEQRGIAHAAVEVQAVVADGTDSPYGPFGGVGGGEEPVKGIHAPVDRTAQPQPLTVQIEVVFAVGFADFEDAESEGLCACVARRGTQFDEAVVHRRIAGRPYLSLGNGDCPTQGVLPDWSTQAYWCWKRVLPLLRSMMLTR